MRKWLGKNSIIFIASIAMTYVAVKYMYDKRGYWGWGTEYIFLFLPFTKNILIEVGTFTKDVTIELFEEVRSWIIKKTAKWLLNS